MTDAQPMPPDPISAAKASMAAHAQDQAQDYVMRRVRSQLKGYLPKVLWPLIPGERGTVAGAVKKDLSKRFWAAVSGLIFSIFFFMVVGAILVGTAVFCVIAVMTAM